jgi:hypothetical protein
MKGGGGGGGIVCTTESADPNGVDGIVGTRL